MSLGSSRRRRTMAKKSKDNIMITGGTGFLGNNLTRYMLAKYPDKLIVNYSRHTYAVNPLTHADLWKIPNYKTIAGDLNNVLLMKQTLEKFKIGTIFHLAASTHVDRSFVYPEEFIRANVTGNFWLLEAIRHLKKKKPLMIYMGTDEVFGDVPEGFCREDELRAPRNPYSASKACAEMYCIAYHASFNLPIVIVRSMNMFGPYQHPEKLIGKIVTRCITDSHFTLYEGGSVRGWIFVKDTCDALDTVAKKGKLGEIYHIPPDAYLTVPEVAQTILRLTGKEHLFDGYKGRRLKDDERYALDATKFTYELRWRPPTGFEDGIKETVDWFAKNEWFWCNTQRKLKK